MGFRVAARGRDQSRQETAPRSLSLSGRPATEKYLAKRSKTAVAAAHKHAYCKTSLYWLFIHWTKGMTMAQANMLTRDWTLILSRKGRFSMGTYNTCGSLFNFYLKKQLFVSDFITLVSTAGHTMI